MNFDFDFDFDFDFEAKPQIAVYNPLIEYTSNFPYNFEKFCSLLTIPIKENNEIKGYGTFLLNSSQNKWYNFALKQYEKIEKIDFATGKFRQNGLSTISTAFGIFSGLCNNYNIAFTGKDESNVQSLYKMIERYVLNLQQYGVQIGVGKKSGQELPIIFNGRQFFIYFRVSSGMGVRGLTLGCLIEDELGHAKNTDEGASEALAGGRNTVRLGVGTPNGMDNQLYVIFKNGKINENLLFIPWHEMKECETDTAIDFADDVLVYLQKYNLDTIKLEKKYWFANKWENARKESMNLEQRFNQEYPPNVFVGFEASATDVFCNTDFINNAFKNKDVIPANQCIIGIDVAGNGANSDKFVVCVRHGNVATFLEVKSYAGDFDYRKQRANKIVRWLIDNKINCVKFNVDVGGIGREFIDVFVSELRYYGIKIPVNSINFATKVELDIVSGEPRKISTRVFMYFKLREWLTTKQVALQDIKELKEELMATKSYSKSGQEEIISKEEISQNLKRSPDYADALALTFAPSNGDEFIARALTRAFS